MEHDKAAIREKIESEIARLRQDIDNLIDLTKPIGPENAIGRVSRMDAINNKSINEASLRQSRETLDKLERALAKIDDPEFGICLKCQQPIPIGRIMLLPHATRCVKCS